MKRFRGGKFEEGKQNKKIEKRVGNVFVAGQCAGGDVWSVYPLAVKRTSPSQDARSYSVKYIT